MSDVCDSWNVQLATGEIRVMTLDQLDEAFQKGRIDENTAVQNHGAMAWTTLGDAAGIETSVDAAPVSAMPNSIAPVAADLGDDDAAPVEFRSRKRGIVVGIVAGAMILGGLGFTVTRFGAESDSAVRAAGSRSGTDAPRTESSAPAKATEEPAKPTLTDEQRRALLEADKLRDAQRKAKAPSPAAPSPRRRSKPSSSPFHAGGNEHDPLNSGP